ncbi:MAG TPA: class I SAM-dependent methyltransferase [Micromonosporaceae bacterium]
MSAKSIGLSDELHAYLVAHNGPQDPIVTELIAQTRARLADQAKMQVAPEQAAFLTFLTRLMGVRHAIEVGTFTGLSALSIARGLADGGSLICCDISAEYTSIARDSWHRAGVADRIELRLGPAAQTLAELPLQPRFEFAFIDADKSSYPTYWAELVPRMRAGGVIAVDNVLRAGRVLHPTDPDTEAMIAFNDLVLADDRVESVMLPLADGLTLARRLP